MTINQNTLEILRTFLNLQKTFMKHCTPTKQLPKVLLLNS